MGEPTHGVSAVAQPARPRARPGEVVSWGAVSPVTQRWRRASRRPTPEQSEGQSANSCTRTTAGVRLGCGPVHAKDEAAEAGIAGKGKKRQAADGSYRVPALLRLPAVGDARLCEGLTLPLSLETTPNPMNPASLLPWTMAPPHVSGGSHSHRQEP
jgi:hypothetical protein